MAGEVASTYLVKGLVRRGVILPHEKLAIFGSEDLFDTSELVARPGPSKSQLAAFQADMADLKPGDFVVHVTHGVGKFLGTRQIEQGDNKGDFMLVEYANDAKLYVPLTRMDLVQKFRVRGRFAAAAGPHGRGHLDTHQVEGQSPHARHGGRAVEALRAAPDERRICVSPDSNWQREFEDAFEFTETKDQLTTVKQIKKDMESSVPQWHAWLKEADAVSASPSMRRNSSKSRRRICTGLRYPILFAESHESESISARADKSPIPLRSGKNAGEIAGRLQLACLRERFVYVCFALLVQNEGAYGLGHGMARIQVQRFFGKFLCFLPITVDQRMGLLDQRIRQNCATVCATTERPCHAWICVVPISRCTGGVAARPGSSSVYCAGRSGESTSGSTGRSSCWLKRCRPQPARPPRSGARSQAYRSSWDISLRRSHSSTRVRCRIPTGR